MLTPEQAQTGLAALVGGGGISAILVAFIGFLTAARTGRTPDDKPLIAFHGPGGAPFDREATEHLAAIAFALTKLVAIHEIKAEEEIDDKGFPERLEGKVGRLMIEAIKMSGRRPA